MKAIRLTFRRTGDITSRIISMYFRLTGIYVTERYIYENSCVDTALKQKIDELREMDYQELSYPGDTFQYDAELFLLFQENDFIVKDQFTGNTNHMIYIVKPDLTDQFEKKYGKESPYISYSNNMKCLDDILQAMEKQKILDIDEHDDLKLIKDIYIGQNYFKTLMESKYFFNADRLFEDKCKEYCSDIEKTINELRKKKLPKWGESKYLHTQYAVAQMVYELNLYCRRNKKSFIYDVDGLITVIKKLDDRNSEYFGNHTKSLMGQVYYELLDKENTAYECFLHCCNNDESIYNAYIFKVKGGYWHDFIADYERANKYYFKSILIFPEYFSAWYKMGYCYYQMNQKSKALFCFQMVIDILEGKKEGEDYCSLAPKELEHLFLAYRQYAGIVYELDADVESAIEYDLKAVKLWKNISYNNYFKKIGEEEDISKFCDEIKNNLNVDKVYEHLSKMYKMANQYDDAEKYKQSYLIK